MRRWLWLLVGAGVAGCANEPLGTAGTFLPPQHYQAMQSAKLCCASYRDMKFARLEPGRETKAVIGPDSPVFEFDGRRSFFAAYELPAGANRVLTVTTVPMNMLLNRYGHVMVPAIQFLDAGHKPIETVQPRYQTDSKPFRGSWAEGQVPVPPAARYAVVIEGKGGGLGWRDRDQPGGVLFVRSGPTGEIALALSGG